MGRPKKMLENDGGGIAVEISESNEVTELSGENNYMEEENTKESKIPSMEDVGWSEFILSEFHPTELDDGYPKGKGFQRLVRKHVGNILESSSKLVQVPTPQNLNRASVEHKLVVLKTKHLEPGEQPYTISITEVADAYIDNIKGDAFAAFPPAIASTRARVRALRLALNVDMVAAEELPDPHFDRY